jgi:hypothetical protein
MWVIFEVKHFRVWYFRFVKWFDNDLILDNDINYWDFDIEDEVIIISWLWRFFMFNFFRFNVYINFE